jgi:hypothetical protein
MPFELWIGFISGVPHSHKQYVGRIQCGMLDVVEPWSSRSVGTANRRVCCNCHKRHVQSLAPLFRIRDVSGSDVVLETCCTELFRGLLGWSTGKPLKHRGYWNKKVKQYSSYSFTTLALDGCEWSASRPGALYPRYALDRRLGGPQTQRIEEKNILPLPGIEPRSPSGPVRSQTLYWLSYPGFYKLLRSSSKKSGQTQTDWSVQMLSA